MEHEIHTYHWVRKATKPPPTFDPRKERCTYKQARKELVETEWVASASQPMYDMPPMYYIPPAYDQSMIERIVEKVSTLKSFLKSCL